MADNDDLRQVQKLHFDSSSKYVYFLLAATGAALGFGLQRLDGLALSWSVSPGLLAVLCWLASFYAGCMRITWTHRAIQSDYSLVQLQRGMHLRQPQGPASTQQAIEITKANTIKSLKWSSYFLKLQFWLLSTGVAAFVVWRILEMAKVRCAP